MNDDTYKEGGFVEFLEIFLHVVTVCAGGMSQTCCCFEQRRSDQGAVVFDLLLATDMTKVCEPLMAGPGLALLPVT